jgi:hypothetical protein
MAEGSKGLCRVVRRQEVQGMIVLLELFLLSLTAIVCDVCLVCEGVGRCSINAVGGSGRREKSGVVCSGAWLPELAGL